MRWIDRHYGYADRVNRRARAAFVAILLVVGGAAFASDLGGPTGDRTEVLGTDLYIGGIGIEGAVEAGTPLPTAVPEPEASLAAEYTFPPAAEVSSIARGASDFGPGDPTATTSRTSGSTTVPPTTPTSVRTTTTTLPPTTILVPPPTTTTTTTLPPTTTTVTPPTTTTTTTTTTLPPTTTTTTLPPTTTTTTSTTTTVPNGRWFAILEARVSCEAGIPTVRWLVYDPQESWSALYQLIIDGDNRGLFAPGTAVPVNGSPASAVETVEAGSHTLTVQRHWEGLLGRNRHSGSDSLTVVVEAGTCS